MKKKLIIVGAYFSSLGIINAQDYEAILKSHFAQENKRLLRKSELSQFAIENVDRSKSLKSDIVKIQQTYNKIPIYGGTATALIKDSKVTYMDDNFEKDYTQIVSKKASLDKNEAFTRILNKITPLESPENYKLLNFNEKEPEKDLFAKVRTTYYRQNNSLLLAYEYMFPEKNSSNYWHIIVNANTGEILEKNNMNLSCNFNEDAYNREIVDSLADENTLDTYFPTKKEITKNAIKNNSIEVANATYNVFAFPLEAPTFGQRTIVQNPWDLNASPQGWHSDGTNNYTNTRGNNVYAYEDSANTDLPGYSTNAGAALEFDYPFNINSFANDNRDAAITNLFYMNNMIHDITYKFGFDEKARNFQLNNFNKGGLGNDYVNAEAQDGEDKDNANFATPADGSRPRMQMFLWNPENIFRLFYNSPNDAIPRMPKTKKANFGATLEPAGLVGDIAIPDVIDACKAPETGSLTDKIALVERGSCNFVVKAKNVQDAGAKALIIYNAPNSSPIANMSGDDSTVTIPSILIENAEGEYIKSKINTGTTVNVTLKDDESAYIYRDASFDNGIIAHEYGHGISNRNTGKGYSCLNSSSSKEQMGEGWSDFLALMITNQPGDNANVARGVGTFVKSQATDGIGIRPAKYSPNFTVNNYTYGKTNGMEISDNGILKPNVHSIGFVWATILWDLHWNYVAKYGYASDITSNINSGSAKVFQLVMDGMKLQECNPTFISGRDAIIEADKAATGGENKCMIWKTFAKRGVGAKANAGSKTNINDQKEDFSIPEECATNLSNKEISDSNNALSIFPNPAKNEFYLKLPLNAKGKVNIDIYDLSGKLITSTKIDSASNNSVSTEKLTNGVYMIKITGLGIDYNTKLIIKK